MAERGGDDRTGRDAGDAMLEARGLTKRYAGSGVAALVDVGLTVGAGEIFAVVGESGSGKTTLLRLIAGLEAPDRGTIRLAGRTVSAPDAWVPPEERPLGMLFQEGALFPHLDVAGNVEFGLREREARRRRRAEVLELVGLSEYGDRYPHQLSGGERRRAALARALAPEPELILLDEPFTGLDANLTSRLRSEMGRILRETGTTALIVLHDTDEVLPLADRIAVLGRGRLAQTGRPEEVYARPRDAYVARLFGPANIFPGRATEGRVVTPLGSVGTEGGDVGEEPRVCYRPEDLELGPAGRYRVEGRVIETGYRGDRLEVRVRVSGTAGPGETVVRIHRDAGRDGPRPEERVSVRSKSGRGHLLRPPDGAAGGDG